MTFYTEFIVVSCVITGTQWTRHSVSDNSLSQSTPPRHQGSALTASPCCWSLKGTDSSQSKSQHPELFTLMPSHLYLLSRLSFLGLLYLSKDFQSHLRIYLVVMHFDSIKKLWLSEALTLFEAFNSFANGVFIHRSFCHVAFLTDLWRFHWGCCSSSLAVLVNIWLGKTQDCADHDKQTISYVTFFVTAFDSNYSDLLKN